MLPSGWPTRGAPGAGRHPRHLRSASDYTILACMHACRPPPPPRIPSSGREPPRASKTRDWLRPPFHINSVLYINKGFPTLFNTPDTLCSHVPPPDRVYMYSLEIALRLAHIRKIHLYFSTHRSLSARCDPPRVSCIPPRARAATCIAPNAPRGPQLYDHM